MKAYVSSCGREIIAEDKFELCKVFGWVKHKGHQLMDMQVAEDRLSEMNRKFNDPENKGLK